MKRSKAVIFDLDGTVLDTLGGIAAALNRALVSEGCPERSVEEVRSFIGNGFRTLCARALGGNSDDRQIDGLTERFEREYLDGLLDFTEPYEGVISLLDTLREYGVYIAVVTNKGDSCAVPMIEHFFGNRVDICRGVRVDSEKKPSPELTLGVLEKLGISVENAVFVGDGAADFETARNCGIYFIPVGYGFTPSDKLRVLSGREPVPDVRSLESELIKRLEL